jgi:outer membrane biosynthesis protein TonB
VTVPAELLAEPEFDRAALEIINHWRCEVYTDNHAKINDKKG